MMKKALQSVPKSVLILEMVPVSVPVPVLVFFRGDDLEMVVLVVVEGLLDGFVSVFVVPVVVLVMVPVLAPELLLVLVLVSLFVPVELPFAGLLPLLLRLIVSPLPVLEFGVVLEVVEVVSDDATGGVDAVVAVAAIVVVGVVSDDTAAVVAVDDVDDEVVPVGVLLGVGVGRLTGTRGCARRSTAGGHLPLA